MRQVFECVDRERAPPLLRFEIVGFALPLLVAACEERSRADVGDRVGPRLPVGLSLSVLKRVKGYGKLTRRLPLSLSSPVTREHSMNAAFGSWLGRRYRPQVVASRLANCRRVENYYGDLDRAYGTARMPIVLEALRYSLEDERHRRPNPSRVPISGNLRDGLATLRHAVALYIEFRESAQLPQSGGRISAPIKPAAGDTPLLSGDEVLGKAANELGIDLVRLVAKAAIWADPNVVRARREIHPHAALFSDYRRGKKGEKRGDVINGERIDDNTKANLAIKIAVFGSTKPCRHFHVCHVWPETCYDVRYHTSLPNLVLLPSALASLSDHHKDVASALRYRSFELFSWHPEEVPQPEKPLHYPANGEWAVPIYRLTK
jgi:hypothetical protein